MAGSLQPGILPRPHELTALKNQKTQRSDRLPTRRPERFFIRPPKQTAQPRSKRTPPLLEGVQGSDAPRLHAIVAHLRFRKRAAPCSSQTLHRNTALYLQENAQPRSKRTSPPLEGLQGRDAPRLRAMADTSDSANNQHSTLKRNAQPCSKRTSPPLEGVQGSDAPRSRATVAHLRFRKQATSSSS